MTHVQSERLLRQEALSAFQKFGEDEDSDDEAEGGLVVRRANGSDDVEVDVNNKGKRDQGYREFLLEMGGGEEEVRELLGVAQTKWSGHREDSGDEGEAEANVDLSVNQELVRTEKEKSKAERKAKKAKADEDFLME